MRRLLALPLVVVLALFAGCGSDGSGGGAADADPAKAVPAGAPLYFEAVVKPDGDLKADTEAALKKILRTDDVGKKLRAIVDDADDKVKVDDVMKWAGKRWGVFIPANGLSADDPPVGIVVPTDDGGAAIDSFRKESPKATKSTYNGIDLWTDASGDEGSVAVVDDYALNGDTAAVKAAIDTVRGGKPMAGTQALADAKKAVGADDSLAFGTMNLKVIFDLVIKEVRSGASSYNASYEPAQSGLGTVPFFGSPDLGMLQGLFDKIGESVAVSVRGDGDAAKARVALVGSKLPKASGSGTSKRTLGDLPAGGWLAAHFSGSGSSSTGDPALDSALKQLQGGPVGQLFDQLKDETGVDVPQDLLSWIDDFSIYASGTSLLDLGAAVSLGSKDPAKSVAAVGKIGKLLKATGVSADTTSLSGYDRALKIEIPSIPAPLFVAGNADRLVIGVNPGVLTSIAKPEKKLGDSAEYKQARSLVDGYDPALMLDLPSVLRLVETLGGAGSDRDYQKAKPYLDVFGLIAIGAKDEGEAKIAHIGAALR